MPTLTRKRFFVAVESLLRLLLILRYVVLCLSGMNREQPYTR